MRARRAGRALAIGLVVALGVGVPGVPGLGAGVAAAGPRGQACTASPFTSGFDAAVRARWPGKRITAAVYDTRTGCQYRYRPDLRITTASVLKIEIMAGVLLRAQRAGRALTASERSLITPMIRTSDDPAANALWSSLGGTAGLAALDRELGLTSTSATSPWGLTSTTASDRNALLRQLVLGQYGPFSASTRATARSFLLDVAPSQRWGLTAGVPSTWPVPLKNGFFPARCCGWRINTSGVVERPDRSAYVATVLSDGWPSQAAGIEAVEYVSKVIASWNLAAIGPHGSAAAFAHQAHRDVLGRVPSFSEEQATAWRVGTDARQAGSELARLLGDPAVDTTSGQVLRLYLGALHRLPEAGTWSGRVAQLRAHERSLTQLADAVATSREFTRGLALSTPAFVDQAYQRVYGRLPSSADRAWWVARLDGGAPRGALLVGLITSNTFRWNTGRQVQVAEAHLAVLRRAPTPAEEAQWVPQLWEGVPVRSLTASLFASPSYTARFAGS